MIHFSGVTKQYGPKILYRDASFQINASEKIGLVGPNGAGKSTLFKILTGEEGYDTGSVSKPDKVKIGYFSQDVAEMKGKSVIEEVLEGSGFSKKMVERISAIESQLSEPMDDDQMARLLDEYGDLQTHFESVGGYQLESRAQEILTGLGIPPEDHSRPVESFSGGWKMRIELAKILLQNPDVLLMDEPTNHLDLETIIWLENWLREFPGAVMMTSHDREFMNRLVNKIVEVAYQKVTTYTGNYDFYEKERDIRKEQLIAAKKRQDDMLAKEEEFISRFAARASHAAQVQSRVKKLEKIDRIEIPIEEKSMQMEWPEPPRGGDEVVKFENLGKIWKRDDGQERLVFNGASGLVKRQDRVAVVGVNGAGKSTFLKILCGQTEPTSGTYQIGASINIGYFSQNSLDVLHPTSTVFEEVSSATPNSSVGFVRNLLGAFKFTQDDVEKKISVLSGGEKARVVLTMLLAKPLNLLILDEPTNHLDITSREVLLDALKRFPGTIMIVSHDRHFLRALTNRVFELDRQHLNILDGHYDYYLEKKLAK